MTRVPHWKTGRRTFEHEWLLESFGAHVSFHTRRMFGGLAAYLFDRLMLVLVEPTRSGRWQWHGVLICTDHAHHATIVAEHPQLAPHAVLRKWLYLDSRHEEFESTMTSIVAAMARNDPRYGVAARSRRRPTPGARSGAGRRGAADPK